MQKQWCKIAENIAKKRKNKHSGKAVACENSFWWNFVLNKNHWGIFCTMYFYLSLPFLLCRVCLDKPWGSHRVINNWGSCYKENFFFHNYSFVCLTHPLWFLCACWVVLPAHCWGWQPTEPPRCMWDSCQTLWMFLKHTQAQFMHSAQEECSKHKNDCV